MAPDPVLAFGPGRVNLIGEHTDYNDGLALPFAVADGVTVRAAQLDADRIEAVAEDLGEDDRFALDEVTPADGWRAFVRGAVGELQAAGVEVPGASLRISGTIARGSGLSSSAALEVALVLALRELAGAARDGDRKEIARLCSRIENDWVGAQTGLLDQLASLYGQPGQAVRIDFRSLMIEPVPLDLAGYELVTLDSGEDHSLAAGGGYNERRRECAEACEQLGVQTLRDATEAMAAELPEPLRRRVRHVVTENERVEHAVAALAAGDLDGLGRLLDESHASLRDLYEVSTPAVESAVAALRDAGAIGARIIGGGFGGNVIGLFGPGGRPPTDAVRVEPGPGATLLDGPQS